MNIDITNPVTPAELDAFLTDLNDRCRAYYQANYPNVQGDKFHALAYDRQDRKVATVGAKNISVWCASETPYYTSQKAVSGYFTRSIYCFIDRATGDILKPASCKGPVKGSKRGNIREGGYWDRCLSPHGVINLR